MNNLKLELASKLLNLGIPTEFAYKLKDKKCLEYADTNTIPFLLFIGGNEIENGTVTLKVKYLFINLVILP